jgi:hypothetical protein
LVHSVRRHVVEEVVAEVAQVTANQQVPESSARSLSSACCDVTGKQGSGIPAGIGADSGKFRLWTGIPGIRDCRRGVPLGRYSGYSGPKTSATCPRISILGSSSMSR